MTKEQLWQIVLGELELGLTRANFTTWFKHTFIVEQEEEKITIGVPNIFTQTWLEKKYHHLIIKILQKITDSKVKEICYRVENLKNHWSVNIKTIQSTKTLTENAAPSLPPINEFKETSMINKFGLNSRYVFDNFIIGKGNELAHAASLAVSQSPGTRYNPLFIYGGVGLGKTHLLQAMGHKIILDLPSLKILYVTSERFTNEYILAVKNNVMKGFKDKYRNVDVLLMDDIQFMSGKEGTQEEFFHTFNTLHQNNNQLVITSDRPPKALSVIEPRLISRFEWGMIADIGQPDLETRIAILQAKCREKNYELGLEILNYIASTIQNNIRELEGALNRIIVYHQLNNTKPILNSVKTILSNYNKFNKKAMTTKQIINLVADFYDLALEDIVGQSREKKLVVPRQIIMYLMRDELGTSFPTIGQELGNRDHTTAMHAYSKIVKSLENDERLKRDIDLIKQRIYCG